MRGENKSPCPMIVQSFESIRIGSRRGPLVWALGLHAAAPGSNLVLVVRDSTLSHFVNSPLVASCQLAFLIMFLLSLNCYFQIIESGVPVN